MKKSFTPTKQQLSAADPAHSVWVTANAGSGKTHVLVERIIRLLLDGAEPSTLLCITFTKAAAAEMSTRLYDKLSRWTACDDGALNAELSGLGVDATKPEIILRARQLFTYVLETPGGLKIQTIHAFCERILQLFPVEAKMAPGFRVLDDRQSSSMREHAKNTLLREIESGADKNLTDAFAIISANAGADSFDDILQNFLSAAQNIRSLLDSEISGESLGLLLKNTLNIDLVETSKSVSYRLEQIDQAAYETHAAILAPYGKHGKHDPAPIMKLLLAAHEKAPLLEQLYFTKDKPLKPRSALMSVSTKKNEPETADFIESETARILQEIHRCDLLKRIEATAAMFTIAKAIYQKTEDLKRQIASYDYDDLIRRTSQLMGNARAAQWVLYKLDSGLNHILLDEAQDTSPAQWRIFEALAAEFFAGSGQPKKHNRTIFVVGDRKQSIYSFQGADAATFAEANRQFRSFVSSDNKSANEIELTISYRSATAIIDAVNRVFPAIRPQILGFDEKDMSEQDHTTNRMDAVGRVEVWPLFTPKDDVEDRDPWLTPLDREAADSPRRELARTIAMTLKSWIGHRQLESQNRLIVPGDIMLLLQSRSPLFSMLIAELRKIGVPVSGADRLKLRESIAIQDLLALAQWLLLPQDDYALATILKSPFVPNPISEDELFGLAYGRSTKTIWEKLLVTQHTNAVWLEHLRSDFEKPSAYEIFAKILLRFRKRMLGRLGPEAGDATDAFLDLALAHEIEHGPSLSGFLHWFNAGETEIKREMEKTSGEVRLMTVHGAKGLEANIVFLPDATSVPKGRSSNQPLIIPGKSNQLGLPLWNLSGLSISSELQTYIDDTKLKAANERNRLLYVAMTRAKDELYICGATGKKETVPKDCWFAMVEPILTVSPLPELPVQSNSQTPNKAINPVIPEWAETDAVPENSTTFERVTRSVSSDGKSGTRKDLSRGTAIHKLLQNLPNIPAQLRETYALTQAKRLNLAESDALHLAALLNSPELQSFLATGSQAEVEIVGLFENGQHVNGRIDRLAVTDTEIFLLDYKTDSSVPAFISPDHVYAQQIAIYADLLQKAHPDHQINAALLWTQSSKLEWLSKELLTQARDQALALSSAQTS
jgi:ATP-dependent helicase/nuclease subunit A